jgi:glucose/arabinose dehydrogenase
VNEARYRRRRPSILRLATIAVLAAIPASALAGSQAEPGQASQTQATSAPARVQTVARGLAKPVYVTATPSEPTRLYVVQQAGLVRVVVGGRLQSRPFADLRKQTLSGGERGLFSIAFSSRYATDRLLYACYTDHEGAINIVELRESNGRATLVRTLLRVLHEDSSYHNGGQLQFGPDGLLYAGFGDGGLYGREPDPHGNSQNLAVLLGKIVRLNPAAGGSTAEIVAYGLRNPWRFSFDSASGDLVIADVGWFGSEEIDVLPAGTNELVNFGWSTYEGWRERRRGDPVELNPTGRLVWPSYTYPTGHAGNCSITGGYVYRGSVARLRGRYVYGDYCSGRIWSLRLAGGRASDVRVEPVRIPTLSSFGLDARGELYAVALTGTIYRFVR